MAADDLSVTDATVPLDKPQGVLLPKVPIRHWGRWLSGILVVAIVGALGYAISQGAIEWQLVPEYMASNVMLLALVNTIELAVLAQGIGIVLGVILALMRLSANPVLSRSASAYTWLFRGLPVLLQIILWYNLALIFPRVSIPVPFTSLHLVDVSSNALVTAFLAALLGLGLSESAYMAEIVRAGLNSVDVGQREAAEAIGMSPGRIVRRVILPQAMRVIVPPTGNDFINMIKGTSLASVIGFVEVTKAAQNLSSQSLAVVEALFAAAAWYMIVVSVANVGQHFLERHYNASSRDPGGRGALLRRIGRSLGTPPFVRSRT